MYTYKSLKPSCTYRTAIFLFLKRRVVNDTLHKRGEGDLFSFCKLLLFFFLSFHFYIYFKMNLAYHNPHSIILFDCVTYSIKRLYQEIINYINNMMFSVVRHINYQRMIQCLINLDSH